MTRNVIIVGEVHYREGDGAMMPVRPGLCEAEVTQLDVTLGWQDGDNRLSAVLPRDEFERLLDIGALRFESAA